MSRRFVLHPSGRVYDADTYQEVRRDDHGIRWGHDGADRAYRLRRLTEMNRQIEALIVAFRTGAVSASQAAAAADDLVRQLAELDGGTGMLREVAEARDIDRAARLTRDAAQVQVQQADARTARKDPPPARPGMCVCILRKDGAKVQSSITSCPAGHSGDWVYGV